MPYKKKVKYVIIKADISGKDDNGAMAQVFIEVWFKLNDTDTDWTKVTNLKSLFSETDDPSLSGGIPYNEGADVDPTTGSYIPASFDAGMIGPAVESKIFAWDAGKQSENFKSDTAKIRIIAIPRKMNSTQFDLVQNKFLDGMVQEHSPSEEPQEEVNSLIQIICPNFSEISCTNAHPTMQ